MTGLWLRLCAVLAAALPWRVLALPGRALGFVAGSVLRIRRAVVEDAMRRAGVADPSAEARAMYASLGAGVMELLWLAGASVARRDRAVAEAVTIDPALREAIGDGPVVLLASHTGNWELAAWAAARALAPRKVAVLAKPLAVGAFHAFSARLRDAAGIRVLPPRGALARARAAIAAGDVVVMPIDQVPDAARHGQRAPFLGAPALVDRAPATLAVRSGATVVVVAGSREADGRHRLHLLDAFRPEAGRAGIAAATERATAALDAFVRARPRDWLWLHRRWRAPRAREDVRLVASPHPG